MQVQVNRLRLQGYSEAPHHQAFLIEDALNTIVSGESRLVLVRYLNLIRPGSSDVRTNDCRTAVASRVARGWSDAMGNACHGGLDRAASANVVWFADAREARQILLERLLKSQSVDGWFWKLAIRLWKGQPLAHWLAEELRAEEQAHPDPDTLPLILWLLDYGHGAIVEQVLLHYLQTDNQAPLRGFRLAAEGDPARPIGDRSSSAGDSKSPSQDGLSQAELHRLAETIRSALPAAFFPLIARLAMRASHRAALVDLVQRFVVRAAPELVLVPDMRRTLATMLVVPQSAGPAPPPRAATPIPSPIDDSLASNVPQPKGASRAQPARHDPVPVTARTAWRPPLPAPAETAEPMPPAPTPVLTAPALRLERRSEAAGLFLLFNPLRHLGWPEWLVHHPAWLGSAPTIQLLNHVARHYQCATDDPLFAWLNEREGHVANRIDADILRMWRIGLDRWLLRRARIKAAELVAKPGWISWQQDTVAVRFSLQKIDLRLRRQALDRDPGWVAWAGLSIRFHYQDQPLFQDGFHDG